MNQEAIRVICRMPRSSNPLVMPRGNPGGVGGELHDVVEHHPILLADGRRPVVVAERGDQCFIQGDSTQKLCVRLNSVIAPVQG